VELIITLPSKECFHVLVRPLVVAGDIIIIGGRGTRGIGRARVLELIEDNLGDRMSHGDPGSAEFPFAEVITSRIVVVVFDLAFLLGKVASVALAGQVVAVGMMATSSIGAGVWHVVTEEVVVAGNLAPTRGRD
jgi:hypothetical protein